MKTKDKLKMLKVVHEFMGLKFGLEHPLHRFHSDKTLLRKVCEKIDTRDASASMAEVYDILETTELFKLCHDRILNKNTPPDKNPMG